VTEQLLRGQPDMSQHDPDGGAGPRPDLEPRIEAIVEDVLARWQRGDVVDLAALAADHPDLAPFLEQRLRVAERILVMARGSSSSRISDADAPTTALPPPERAELQRERSVHLQCPHCGNPIQLVEPAQAEVTCRICGSTVHIESGRPAAPPAVPARRFVGRFEILETLGRGGFGIVYRARDQELARDVALKIPRLGYFASDADEERFLREARSAARLRHPRIVPVYEVGRADDLPYIISALIEGQTLADLIASRQVAFRDAAQWMADIAEAIDCAHRERVIHRDIKPSNILLDQQGNAFVTDFGLARVDEGEFTITLDGQILGTAAYMSPEQAAGDQQRVDARSDIYGLGVVLYRLLTGELPFRGGRRLMLQQILHDEPRSLRSLNEFIPRDLETITLKALAKDPARRYASAAELAADLRRWLQGETIRARPTGVFERGWRWCRRRPVTAGLLASIALLLLVMATAGSVWGWRESVLRRAVQSAWEREQGERRRANDQARSSQLRLARQYAMTGIQRMHEGDYLAALPWLVQSLQTEGDTSPRAAPHALRLGSVLSHCPKLISLFAGESRIRCGAFSPDGQHAVCGFEDGLVALWHADTGRVVATMRHGDTVRWVAFHPNGQQFVTASMDHTVQIWDARDGRRVLPPLRHEDFVSRATFSPDGRLLVTASSDDTAVVWDATRGTRVGEPLRHPTDVKWAEFTPDGKRILTIAWREIGAPCDIRLFDLAERQLLGEPMHHGDIVQQLSFSPDGTQFVTACRDKTARIWNLQTTKLATPEPLPHDAEVVAAFFAPQGQRVVTATVDGGLRIWDAATGKLIGTPILTGDVLRSATLSPDGRFVALAGEAGRAVIWQLSPPRPLCAPLPHGGPAIGVRFAHEGRRVLTFSDDGAAKVWDLAVEDIVAPRLKHTGHVLHVRFSPSGRSFVTCGHDGAAHLWSSSTLTEGLPPLQHAGLVMDADFSPDETLLATAVADATAGIWNTQTGKAVRTPLAHPDYVRQVRFSPDGQRLLTGCSDGKARLWDVASGKLLFQMPHGDQITDIAFSIDGTKIATAGRDNAARVWDAATGRALVAPLQHEGPVMCCRFNPTGTQVVTASQDRTAVLWNLPGGQRSGEPFRHGASVWDATFSPDGRTVLTCGKDGEVALWNHGGAPRRLFTVQPFGSSVLSGAFSRDGRLILTASERPLAWSTRRLVGDGAAQLWDAAGGDPITPVLRHFSPLVAAALSPDSSLIVTVGSQGAARVWRLRPETRPVADLKQWATLLSGQQIDARNGAVHVAAPQLLETWRSLRAQYPSDFLATPDQIAAWKSHLAETAQPVDGAP